MTAANSFSLTNCGPFDRALARVGLKSTEPPQLFLRALLPALVPWLLAAFALLEPLAVFVGLSVVVGLAPLVVFWRPLRTAKGAGMLAYGTLASRYVQDFHRKWIGTRAGAAPLDASGDVQGLADIGGGFERVYAMRPLPITLKVTVAFAVAAAAPMLPLLLTVMPLRDLLKLLMQAMI